MRSKCPVVLPFMILQSCLHNSSLRDRDRTCSPAPALPRRRHTRRPHLPPLQAFPSLQVFRQTWPCQIFIINIMVTMHLKSMDQLMVSLFRFTFQGRESQVRVRVPSTVPIQCGNIIIVPENRGRGSLAIPPNRPYVYLRCYPTFTRSSSSSSPRGTIPTLYMSSSVTSALIGPVPTYCPFPLSPGILPRLHCR